MFSNISKLENPCFGDGAPFSFELCVCVCVCVCVCARARACVRVRVVRESGPCMYVPCHRWCAHEPSGTLCATPEINKLPDNLVKATRCTAKEEVGLGGQTCQRDQSMPSYYSTAPALLVGKVCSTLNPANVILLGIFVSYDVGCLIN